MVLTDDINCRLPRLTSETIRPRDKEFINFVLNTGVQVKNDSTPTCYHQGGSSVNDYVLTKNTVVDNNITDKWSFGFELKFHGMIERSL